MPTLPRPFTRRRPVVQPSSVASSVAVKGRPPIPARRPIPTNTAPVTAPPVRQRKTLADRLFPVRPGMAEPSWSRVLGLIVFMALVWEIFSFAYTYFAGINVFGGRMPAHNSVVAWQATIQTLPWALLLSALGSVPGFWVMRSRIRRANLLLAQERAAQRAAASPGSGQGQSARARRRREGKRSGKR